MLINLTEIYPISRKPYGCPCVELEHCTKRYKHTLSDLLYFGDGVSSSGFFVFKSITGAKMGADDFGLLRFGIKFGELEIGGPIGFEAAMDFGFLTCNCDCINFTPVDHPTAISAGGAPRSSSSYRDIFHPKSGQDYEQITELLRCTFGR